ncbi:leucyl aminopeptidase [Candidatus Woesearchaeota archaeon]|nr:leucyl aminopeptidase [Candidatus Woesearchaeota archaeon]
MALKIEAISKNIAEIEDKCIAIAFFEDNLKLNMELEELDRKTGDGIKNLIKNKDFKAEANEVKTFYADTKGVKYVALLGLGKEKEFNLNKLMDSASVLSKKIRGMDIRSFSIYFDSFRNKNFDFEAYLEKITQAAAFSLYQFTKYKTKDLDKIKTVDKVNIIVNKDDANKAKKAVDDALVYSEAVIKTRDLVNTPPNVAIPEYVSAYAKETARKNGLKFTVLDEKQLEKLGMECYMAVARASVNKPRMFILEYKGAGDEKPIVLIGKGVTYDTGGVNTKPANYMANMKDDKAGACSVIHVLEACARLKLKVNLVGIGAMAENSISGSAYKPDDVLKSYSGITVEVIHSDAEGRMVLADALAYSLKFKPKAIIDLATLTGAAIIALGYNASPIMGNDQKLIDKMKKASDKSLEKVWEFPLWEEYEELIKSDIADIKHLGSDIDAGSIIGGIFLKKFVNDTPWVHIDIGGAVWAKQEKSYKTKGATGFGVRLLIDFLRGL